MPDPRNRPVRNRGSRLVLVLAVALMAALLVPTPTQAAAVKWRGVITFEKNYAHPHHSLIRWHMWRIIGTDVQLREHRVWRAGSGMGGKRGTNSCINNVGWLPNGTYRLKFHRNYGGRLIKGRAFQIDDKRCANGNRRFALFIHTEQGSGNRQCKDRKGDQVCRWEFPKINDYKSAGCIKMSPGDLKQLADRFTHFYRAGKRYPTSTVELRVVNGR